MLKIDDELVEAVKNWRDNRENFKRILLEKLETHSMTEISNITGIKRTTLYYLIYGQEGKLGTDGKKHPS